MAFLQCPIERPVIIQIFVCLMCQNCIFFIGIENSVARIWVWLHSVGLAFFKMKSNYSMTAVFTVKEGSQDRRAKKNKTVSLVSLSLHLLYLWSAMKVCLDIAVFFFLHCWTVISTDLSGSPAWMCQCLRLSLGVGDGGEGGGEQAVASIFCDERTRLVSHRSGI